MSKKNKSNETVTPATEAPTPVDTGSTPAPAPVVNRFTLTLEEQVKAYLATGGYDEVTKFLEWSKANPPVAKAGEPSTGSVTAQVWAYCDGLAKAGTKFTRKDVVEALVAQGVNRATASTQFQRWAKARGYSRPAAVYGEVKASA
jgi:hypothetical protein